MESTLLADPHQDRKCTERYTRSNPSRAALFTAAGATRYQYVSFAGERNNADPNFNPNQKGESWMVIMQHAILQEMGLSTTSPPGGNPYYALPILCGTPSTSTGIAGTADVRAGWEKV